MNWKFWKRDTRCIEIDLDYKLVGFLLAEGFATMDKPAITLTKSGNQMLRDYLAREIRRAGE